MTAAPTPFIPQPAFGGVGPSYAPSRPGVLSVAYDAMKTAMAEFAAENDDGFGRYNWLGASDLADEGYAIGFEASQIADEAEREAFIENETDAFSEEGRRLAYLAATYRALEINAAQASVAVAQRRAA